MSLTKRTDTAAAFGELGRMLQEKPPVRVTLLKVAELVRQTLTDVQASSITVVTDDRGPYTVVFSGPVAVDLDERQYDLGSGPCLDAASTLQTVVVDHHDPLGPYGELSAMARAAGVSHTVSIGLPLGRQLAAGLNLYTSSPLDQSSLEQAEAFAGYAAAAAGDAGPHQLSPPVTS